MPEAVPPHSLAAASASAAAPEPVEIRPQVVRADVAELGVFHDQELVERRQQPFGDAG